MLTSSLVLSLPDEARTSFRRRVQRLLRPCSFTLSNFLSPALTQL
uniref:Uncharacterized protein n=1 Tax=Arundo donax TaxID=35708 RepID=A0A0A9CUH5_ARUDO